MNYEKWSTLSGKELLDMNGGETRNSLAVVDWFEALYKVLFKK